MRNVLALVIASLVAHARPAPDDLSAPVRTGMESQADHALVIGIEDYAFIPDVPYAKRDARAFHDLLLYTRGIPQHQMRMLDHQVSREKIIEAATALGQEAGPDSVVWIYYAGHGAGSPDDGSRILLGADAQQDPASFAPRSVGVEELKRLAGANGARVMLITDTCYTGTGRDGNELISGKRFLVPTYAVDSGPMVQEWVAASPGELSGPLEDVEHGAFTYFTLLALRGAADGEVSGTPDGAVHVSEMQAYVTRMLRGAQVYDQTPQLLGDGDWPLVEGLDTSPAAVASKPPSPPPVTEAPVAAPAADVSIRRDRTGDGFAFGIGLGTPATVRLGYEFGRQGLVSAVGLRGGVGVGLLSGSFYGAVPILAYGDFPIGDKWDLEVGAGNIGGLAVQYDPPSPFQLQMGGIVSLDIFFSSVVVSPDLAAEWVW